MRRNTLRYCALRPLSSPLALRMIHPNKVSGGHHGREFRSPPRRRRGVRVTGRNRRRNPAGAARNRSTSFYAKAKDEGAFAFYVGGPTAPWENAGEGCSNSAIRA
jgi:hypothetical protein